METRVRARPSRAQYDSRSPQGWNDMQTVLDITQIQAILPHRYPFLLVDRVIEYEPGKRVVGLKNVTLNEPFFEGHFPGAPVMPGVLIVEAMAQTAGVLMLASLPDRGSLPSAPSDPAAQPGLIGASN